LTSGKDDRVFRLDRVDDAACAAMKPYMMNEMLTLAEVGLAFGFNQHMEGDGEIIFRHACKLGLEIPCPSGRILPTAPGACPIGSK
jgi:hypothetical protein